MKIGTMLSDTLRSLFKRPITQQYPFVKLDTPKQLRGKLYWNPEGCTGCALCVKDCPANALELVVNDKKEKRFVFRYHADRCTYCAQCVQSCRFSCLGMSSEQWELASVNKDLFTVYYGSEADVESFLAKFGLSDAAAPEKA